MEGDDRRLQAQLRRRHAAVVAVFTSGLRAPSSVEAWGRRAMEIVNGFICMNCCDVDKARAGQDPHQATDQVEKKLERQLGKSTPADFGPAVTLGGSLQANPADTPAGTSATSQAAQGASGPAPSSAVDLVV